MTDTSTIHPRISRRRMLHLAGAGLAAAGLAAALAGDALATAGEPEREVPTQRLGRPTRTRGLFLPFHLLARAADVADFKALVLASGANTIVVDIKNPWGYINVPFEHKLAPPWRTYLEDTRPLEALLTWAEQQGLFVIARQVVMTDGQLARFHPEHVLRRMDGEVWQDLSGTPWANPFDPAVADYNAAIAEAAAARLGIRQVQFDFIRFPSDDSDTSTLSHTRTNTAAHRVAAIAGFLQAARERLARHGALLTADLFGYSAFEYQGDLGIGQDLDGLAPHLDGVSPMAYPSLYRTGIYLDACPNQCDPGIDYPYEIVELTVRHMRERLARLNPACFVEPWIQVYAPADLGDIRRQHRAALAEGAVGVLAWHTNFRRIAPEVFRLPGGRRAASDRRPPTNP